MDISIMCGDIVKIFGAKTAFKMISDAGFTAVDWTLMRDWDMKSIRGGIFPKECIYDRPFEELFEFYSDDIRFMHENGLKPALAHAPYPAYILDIPEFTDRCIKIYSKLIRLCDKVGCPYLVIHPLSATADISEAAAYDFNIYLYSSLIPTLLETNVKVCLENMFVRKEGIIYSGACLYPEDVIKYIDTLNAMAGKECFAFCLDIGHLFLTCGDLYTFFYKMGNRIKVLHIHDNGMVNDDHMIPYTGKINWEFFIKYLKEFNYNGPMNLELKLGRIPDELLPSFIKTAADCAGYFAKRVEE